MWKSFLLTARCEPDLKPPKRESKNEELKHKFSCENFLISVDGTLLLFIHFDNGTARHIEFNSNAKLFIYRVERCTEEKKKGWKLWERKCSKSKKLKRTPFVWYQHIRYIKASKKDFSFSRSGFYLNYYYYCKCQNGWLQWLHSTRMEFIFR